jgi:hemoglobin
MRGRATLLEALGGEAGCRRLSAAFYARVGKDPVLRPLFPGKNLRCATEQFAAFLIQFLGGDEEQTQARWWLSLRESHSRFKIGTAERSAWLKHMGATLDAAGLDEGAGAGLRQFFLHSSAYVVSKGACEPENRELAAHWAGQRALDDAVGAIADGRDHEALRLAAQFGARPTVFVGLLARMMQAGRGELLRFVVEAVERDPSLAARRFGGRSLLHFAAGAGCREVVALLLRMGVDPNILDSGGHTPLYRAANECGSEAGPEIVRSLVLAGADVNACGGVTRATALHMAARRGFVGIAATLLDLGAATEAKDSKGVTPLRRALNCRRETVARLLVERGAIQMNPKLFEEQPQILRLRKP